VESVVTAFSDGGPRRSLVGCTSIDHVLRNFMYKEFGHTVRRCNNLCSSVLAVKGSAYEIGCAAVLAVFLGYIIYIFPLK